MEKKKVILTLCKIFPVTHGKAGEPTGFEGKLKSGDKIHTIRYNAKGVWDGRFKDISAGKKYLSVREWTGRPYNSEQRELVKFDKIGLQKVKMEYSRETGCIMTVIDGKAIDPLIVAKNDGLTVQEFIEWFFGNNKENTFEGVVIHFTDFRY